MRIILGDGANASEPLKNTGFLISVHSTEFEETQGKLAVRTASAPEDQVVHGAVHGLEVVQLAIIIHRGEHAIRVVRKVSRSMEEFFLRDVRGTHVKEAIFNVGLTDVVLHDALKHTTLGVEDRQSRTQLFWEGEEIKFSTEATVVASFRFLESLLVGDKVIFRGPGSSVDSLQLIISLVAAPVGGRRLGQRKSVADEFC